MLSRWFSYFCKTKQAPVFIPHQNYALPYHIICYIISHGKSIVHFKLFNTCKVMNKKIRGTRWRQVDKLMIDNYIMYRHPRPDIFFENNELTFFTNLNYDLLAKNQPLKFKVLDIDYFETKMAVRLSQILDLSNLEKFVVVEFDFGEEEKITMDTLQPFLTPTVQYLDIRILPIADGNLLHFVLTNMLNVQHLEFTWQDNITLLNCSHMYERKNKFQYVFITGISRNLPALELIDFIQHFMAPQGTLELFWDKDRDEYFRQSWNAVNEFVQHVCKSVNDYFKNTAFDNFNLCIDFY